MHARPGSAGRPHSTRALFMLTAWLAVASSPAAAAIPTVLLPVPTSPLVTFRIQFRAGAVDDPAVVDLALDPLLAGLEHPRRGFFAGAVEQHQLVARLSAHDMKQMVGLVAVEGDHIGEGLRREVSSAHRRPMVADAPRRCERRRRIRRARWTPRRGR